MFKQLVKENAFLYLRNKQLKGSKGRSTKYDSLQIEDYLLPEANISIQDKKKKKICAKRCRTNPFGALV